jgi:N-acetylglucosamine kinase-like BadF-type ATPase
MINVLAIDAGGTSTRAVLLNETGHCLGYGSAGGGNPISSGPERAAASILAAAEGASDAAGLPPTSVTHTLIAMAGMSVSGSRDWVSGPLATREFPPTVTVASDLLAIFSSGTWQPDGYAMVAGTGAAGIRVRGGQVERTADGLGWLLGDAGSGYWIGHRVAAAVIASLDGRGAETALVPLVLEAAGIENSAERGPDGRPIALRDLVEALYRLRPVELSRFAPLAFEATTDAVARAILDDAISALARLFSAISAPDLAGPLVLGGSVLTAQPRISDGVTRALREEGFSPEMRKVPDGVVGAAVLALRLAGTDVDAEVFERITTTLAHLR